ncbi:MAG: site-2 protease family protein [Anaerolineales bacterium]|nr:site-2 protease family protein [Anaerolineales bacterium]MCS7247553.1 site-2 protease family protein [Anaerolineales bacterium]MDW8161364.1 site-2 protease family protein [Anaerolineales bacterium]MDW8447381.1 site-2 protease family protein [Anaerolineales bacterium]
MMFSTEYDPLTSIIARHLRISDVTQGDGKQPYAVRYRGQLYGDSEQAYEQLSAALKPLGYTPLFRMEKGQHVIYLVAALPDAKPGKMALNVILFVLTVISVIIAGILYSLGGQELPLTSRNLEDWLPALRASLSNGVAFAISLLAILLAHEFGHYLVGRAHGEQVTLPYFLPFPFSAFGTLGAFINMKAPPKNKRALLDISLAGPLAGLAVAFPILILGLALSEVTPLPSSPHSGVGIQIEGNSLLYLFAKWIVHGKLLPQPPTYGDLPPWLYWLRYIFTGRPFPYGGVDVLLHPVAWAGWAGLLVTSLNLIPAGQLDGGHVAYVLLGKKAHRILPLVLGALVLLGFVWNGWWIWALLVFAFGRQYAEPLDQITELDSARRLVAWFAVLLFVLVFIPVPLLTIS